MVFYVGGTNEATLKVMVATRKRTPQDAYSNLKAAVQDTVAGNNDATLKAAVQKDQDSMLDTTLSDKSVGKSNKLDVAEQEKSSANTRGNVDWGWSTQYNKE